VWYSKGTKASTTNRRKPGFSNNLPLWPALSPDLTPYNYCLWVSLKHKTCKSNRHTDTQGEIITRAVAQVPRQEIKTIFTGPPVLECNLPRDPYCNPWPPKYKAICYTIYREFTVKDSSPVESPVVILRYGKRTLSADFNGRRLIWSYNVPFFCGERHVSISWLAAHELQTYFT